MKLLALLALALLAFPASAATLPATPLSFDAVWKAAACGDTLFLAAGTYNPPLAFRGYDLPAKACAALPIVIDARQVIPAVKGLTPAEDVPAKSVELVDWVFNASSGITIRGGVGKNRPSGNTYGVAMTFKGSMGPDGAPIYNCRNIRVEGTKFVGPYHAVEGEPFVAGDGKGLSILGCQGVAISKVLAVGFANSVLVGLAPDVAVTDLECTDATADCLDLGQVWRVKLDRISARDFHVGDGEHPDVVQFMPRPFYPNTRTPAPPSSDIEIRHVYAVSAAQGIFLGNHIRDYPADAAKGWPALSQVSDGGYDRVLIEDNVIGMNGGSGITVGAGRNVTIRNNRVMTLPSGTGLAGILTPNTTGLTRCSNVVADAANGKRGSTDAPCL